MFTAPSKPSGRFYTMPMFYQGGKKKLERVKKSGNESDKMLGVRAMAEKNVASLGGNTNPGCVEMRIEDGKKGDFKL
jgi:hypothetical protein